MSAPAVEFRAVGETPRCICGASAPAGFCADFPACLPQTAVQRPSLAEVYDLLDRAHNMLLAVETHGPREQRSVRHITDLTNQAKHALHDLGARR